MIRTPKTATSRTVSIPAPVGGLNAKDSWANMPVTDATKMDNAFPGTTSVSTRAGSSAHVTGLPAWVETLMAYNSGTTSKFFAISNTAVYDVSVAGAVGAAVVTSLTNAQWQYENFGTAGGQFMYAVNGVDKPLYYDGAAWVKVDGASTPAITGVTTTTLAHVQVFKNRLWFVQKSTFTVWYLPTSSVGGAATSINFAPLFRLGGYLMGMVTWTIDNSGGIDDYAAFVSSQGEVALYRGSDPASASTWALVGMFRIGKPIGRRFYVKLGSDVILLTSDGFVPLSKAMLTDRVQNSIAVSDKIQNLVNSDVSQYGGNFGWEPVFYPAGNKLFINVPQVQNTLQYQYVMNTITGSWCRYTGWNAACFEVFNDNLYFGGNTVVDKAETGNSDKGADITSDIGQAFSYFDAPGVNKFFKMLRPVFLADGAIHAAVALNIDYNDTIPTSTPSFSGSAGSTWNTASWDTSPWGVSGQITKDWLSVGALGYSAGLRMRLSSSDFSIAWQSTDFVYEVGGVL